VRWSEDIDVYTCNALAPSEIDSLEIDEDEKQIDVVVATNQLSLAIGHKGQNVRLASKLIGYKINVVASEEEDLSIDEQLVKELAKSSEEGKEETENKAEQTEAIKDKEIKENAEDIESKEVDPPESTESEAELRKGEDSEDSEKIIENKDDNQKEEVAEQIEANEDFETNSVNEVVVDTKNSDTKEKPELEVEVESDAS